MGSRFSERIKLAWPNGWTEPDDLGNSTRSSDPNAHYRPYLEQNLGTQGHDWDWYACESGPCIVLCVLPEHRAHITHLAMIWKTV